jgi:hypothetical protein
MDSERTLCDSMVAKGIALELDAIILKDVGLTAVIVVVPSCNPFPANMKTSGDKNQIRINITNKPLKYLVLFITDAYDLAKST